MGLIPLNRTLTVSSSDEDSSPPSRRATTAASSTTGAWEGTPSALRFTLDDAGFHSADSSESGSERPRLAFDELSRSGQSSTAPSSARTSRSRAMTESSRVRNTADQDMRERLDEMLSPEFLDAALQGVPSVYPMTRLGEFRDAELEQRFLVAHRASFLPRLAIVLACYVATLVCFLVYSMANIHISQPRERHLLLAVEVVGVVTGALPLMIMYSRERLFLAHANVVLCLCLTVSCFASNGLVLFFFHFEGARALPVLGIGCAALLVTGLVRLKYAIPLAFGISLVFNGVAGRVGAAANRLARPIDANAPSPTTQTVMLFYGLLMIAVYSVMVQRSRRLAFAMELRAAEERDRVHNLVTSVVPERVAGKMVTDEAGHTSNADDLVEVRPHAAVLAVDIVGFTRFTQQRLAQDVFAQISSLFDAFDDNLAGHDAEKLVTIGDAYLATVAPSTSKTDECELDMACKLVHLARDFVAIARTAGLQIRVGIATGRLATGFIGSSELPSYRAWGAAYDHAQALESQSRANMVAIDSDLADLLRSKADFRFPLSPCRDDSGDCVPGVHLVDMSESRVEAVDDFAE